MAASADGTKLVGASYSVIYTSTNSGGNWQTNPLPLPNQGWNSVACSADGTVLIAAAGNSAGPVYFSTNSGLAWSTSNIPSRSWWAVASSADGSKLFTAEFATGIGGSIFRSTNSGLTWVSSEVTRQAWRSLASSADGTKLVASYLPGGVYVSADSGATWEFTWDFHSAVGNLYFDSIASSADGIRLLGGTASSGFYSSINSGSTWVSNNIPVVGLCCRASVASSADGFDLVASSGGAIFLSRDGGTSWVSNNIPNQESRSVACSADGNVVFAAVSNGGIWRLQRASGPRVNISNESGVPTISWVVPSSPCVLQQSVDLTSWSEITNKPNLNLTNLQYQLTLPSVANGGAFYRLAPPGP